MHVPAPLTASTLFTQWQLDVPALIVVVALAAGYLAAMLRLRRGGVHWPWWRALMFLVVGLGSVVVVTMSSIAFYDRVLFWTRAVQYAVLVSMAPLFLAVGNPIELARRGLGERGRVRLDAVLHTRPVRVLSFPLVGALLGLVALMVVYFSPLYRLSLTNGIAHHLVMLGLLVVGLAFFIAELDHDSGVLPAWCGPGLRVVFAMIDGLVDALPGIIIMTMHTPLAHGYYAALGRSWGPSLRWDQTIGGALMLTLSELIALPFLIVLVVEWIHADEQQAREVDLLIAERYETRPATSTTGDGAVATPDDASAEPGVAAGDASLGPASRPWWEVDSGPLDGRGH